MLTPVVHLNNTRPPGGGRHRLIGTEQEGGVGTHRHCGGRRNQGDVKGSDKDQTMIGGVDRLVRLG